MDDRKKRYREVGKQVGEAVTSTLIETDKTGREVIKGLEVAGESGKRFLEKSGAKGKKIIDNLGKKKR